MQLIKFKNTYPEISSSAYISEGVFVIGDVKIGSNSSIWFGSILRGDVAPIVIGENTNIQDGTVIHTSRINGGTYIGNNVTIGHKALIHAATIADNAFIGMRATIMDKAVVESFGIVAAGAVLTNGKIVKTRELWAGVPARFVRNISDQEVDDIKKSAQNYVDIAKEYMKN